MAVEKRSMSFSPALWAELDRIAAEQGRPVSTVAGQLLGHAMTLYRGLRAMDEYEAEHGAFTAEELAAADRLLDEAGVGVPQEPGRPAS